MESILYVGMDVHTTNYTLCSYMIEGDKSFGLIQISPDYLQVVKYVNKMKRNIGNDIRAICGYEAGCLGYSLYRDLTRCGIECVILAPPTTLFVLT